MLKVGHRAETRSRKAWAKSGKKGAEFVSLVQVHIRAYHAGYDKYRHSEQI